MTSIMHFLPTCRGAQSSFLHVLGNTVLSPTAHKGTTPQTNGQRPSHTRRAWQGKSAPSASNSGGSRTAQKDRPHMARRKRTQTKPLRPLPQRSSVTPARIFDRTPLSPTPAATQPPPQHRPPSPRDRRLALARDVRDGARGHLRGRAGGPGAGCLRGDAPRRVRAAENHLQLVTGGVLDGAAAARRAGV